MLETPYSLFFLESDMARKRVKVHGVASVEFPLSARCISFRGKGKDRQSTAHCVHSAVWVLECARPSNNALCEMRLQRGRKLRLGEGKKRVPPEWFRVATHFRQSSSTIYRRIYSNGYSIIAKIARNQRLGGAGTDWRLASLTATLGKYCATKLSV